MTINITSQISSVSFTRPSYPEKPVSTGNTLLELRQQVSTIQPDQTTGEKTHEATDKVVNLEKTVTRMNEFAQQFKRELHFSIDENSGQTVVKVIDAETSEIIRQIPSEELLELARHLEEGKPLGLFEASA